MSRRRGRPVKYEAGHVVVAVRVDHALALRLQREVERRDGLTKNVIVERALEQYIAKLEKQRVVRLP